MLADALGLGVTRNVSTARTPVIGTFTGVLFLCCHDLRSHEPGEPNDVRCGAGPVRDAGV